LNSKNWNRVITGAAAVSLTIGMMAPMAFAATSATQYNTRTINVGSGYTAVVNGIVAKDVATMTEFLPVYYMMQGMGKLGYTVNWNGGTRILNITTPAGVTVNPPSATVGAPNANQMVIQLNGTNVQLAPRVVAKDPASGVMTTFAPIYYLNQALKLAGFTNTYNGQSWTLTGQAASQSQSATLSNITVSNASNGTGAVASPAVSLNNTAISLSTTLKDANGNPVPNTAVTYNVSNYGSYPTGYLPTVDNASGTVISGTQKTNAEQYTVYTDASGVATISLTGPSGSTYAYQVVATAPFTNSSNNAISSPAAYLQFVANNQAGLSPFAGTGSPYSAALGQPLPISLTLPANASGQPQANVLVTLKVTQTNGTSLSNASFVSASGATLGATIQVATNSAGVAQAYLSDANGETVEVQAAGLPSGVNVPSATYITFAQSGVPAKINNLSVSTNTPNIGQNVNVSGQLQDSAGNPVANGQILVTSPNGGSNDFAYVNGTTTTTFPLVGTVVSNALTNPGLAVGTPANTSYGDLITADSAGNFSFVLTDPRVETQQFYMFPVSNGEVTSTTPLNGTANTNNTNIVFGQSTTLATLSLGAFDSYVAANSATTLTGLSANINGGGAIAGALTANNVANVYVEPQSSAGHHTGGVLNSTAESYSLSLSNGGLIYSINNVALTSPAAAVTLSYDGAGHFTANGQTIAALTGAANISDFAVGVSNANSGNTTLTVAAGSVSSTATVNFVGGTPAQAANFSPGSVIVTGGQQQQVTFQVQDAAGNPVANTATNVMTDQAATDGFFITQVNGVTLQESVNMGSSTNASYTTEATPIPLGAAPASLDYSVGIPGVAAWTNSSNYFTVYSDASGNVTLTLQAGGLNYPSAVTSSVYTPNPNNYAPSVSGSGWLGFYSNGNGDSNVPLYVVTSAGAPTSAYTGTITPTGGTVDNFTGSLLGQINW
jgi:protocatechuate 3,4-dioxygenase beta subunit